MNIDGKVFKRAKEKYETEIHLRELEKARMLDELSAKMPRIGD